MKKNGSAPMDEIPLYSMPDKSKKQHDPGVSVCTSRVECLYFQG